MNLPPSSVLAFKEALEGDRGDLDAWLECNNEAEVRAHVRAYAAEAVRVALEAAASIKTFPQVAIFPAGMELAAKAYQKGMDDYAVAVRALIPKD